MDLHARDGKRGRFQPLPAITMRSIRLAILTAAVGAAIGTAAPRTAAAATFEVTTDADSGDRKSVV